MLKHRFLNIAFSIVIIASLFLSGSMPASAQQARNAPAGPPDESKIPHYFGPYPNWANSPLTMPDAQVVITGNGTGATAEASVGANGEITGITVTNPGSGYSTAKVNIVGSGTGASAKATIVKRGAVIDITVDTFGAGYTAPVVAISGGGGSGATATAYGRVDQVTVSDGGANYTFPTVDFDLPAKAGGVQAKGHIATFAADGFDGMDSNGTILSNGVIVDSPGSGYSTAPGVVIRNGTTFNPISGATEATASSSLSVTSIVVNDPGTNYKTTPSVNISDPTGSGATATATIDNGVISAIDVTKPGSGYITTGGIRKFVDTLPGVPGLTSFGDVNNLGQYMPIAVADTTTFSIANGSTTDADYYVIALVQYREQMNSSLPAEGTLLREYVQLHLLGAGQTCADVNGVLLETDLVDGTTTPTLMPDGSQACGYDNPHFLGPIIVAQKDKAVRITFYNLLPTGTEGDLFIPTDSTLMGSGLGPQDAALMNPLDEGSVTDGVRNQYCSQYPKPAECFQDNRATLHLHGGITPWISDGTPRQWITPANETTPYPEGVSVGNVPDMIGDAAIAAGVPDCSDPRDGCSTFYYTNQQSARLMFYHDHAWGITRLNVYAGEAAGYIIQDPTEQALVDGGIIPADQIPLVIQDHTFVPSPEQLAWQDPTWDASRWGGEGNMWLHHVYMPAQNPGDPSGMSAFGRWMYGPWFWPPAIDAKYQPIANPYYNKDPKGPDGIRGTADDWSTDLAVPCNLDDPATWQYDTDPFCEPAQIPGTPNISAGMEQFNDTPIVNGTAYPTVTLEPKAYRLRILNAANDRFFNLQWYVADPNTASTYLNANGDPIGGTEVAFKPTELAAAQLDPNVFPTPDTSVSPPGPSWIQIGTEGGFLPAPVVVPNQPITWITDPTRFDFGNVDLHSLLVAPAERSDVIVDFSKFAGQTLILYNDAPAAFPARVSSYDYYTGGPDLSPAGAPTTLPGYGPNTRTIMQVKISNGSNPSFNLSALQAAFRHQADGSGVFESGQHPIIVGQAAYNSAYGTSFASSGWCNSPTNPSAKCDGFARISEQGGDQFKFDTLSGQQVSIPLEPKAIHDEMNAASFDEFGRMTANLGLEAVPATPGLQNILLYPYTASPTEIFDATSLPKNDITMTPVSGISSADGTQIWKITHNGVDTHPIHWHLYDLQVLNRVTWDNIIIPPDPNELGWKDTVRISPLEDTYVAIRPIIPYLPFDIPNSVRELNTMLPDGMEISPGLLFGPDGNPITVLNHVVNFGWEYVFHCHILSHEEMDMMRPVSVAMPPVAPGNIAFDLGTMTLSWTDESLSETAFVVEKLVNGVWTPVDQQDRLLSDPNTAGDTLNYQDLSFAAGDQYRVFAQNTVGDVQLASAGFPVVTTKSAYAYYADVSGAPAAPSSLTANAVSDSQVDLAWMDNSSNEDGFVVERSDDNGATWNQVVDPDNPTTADVTTFSDTTVAPASTYLYQVYAFNASGNSQPSNTATVITPGVPPAAPTNLMTTAITSTQVDLAWTDSATTEDGFIIERSSDAGATWSQVGQTVTNVAAFSDTTVIPGGSYLYQVYAFNVNGNSLPSNSLQVDVPNVTPADPTNLTATTIASTQVDMSWTDNSNNEEGFRVERSDDGGGTWNQVGNPTAANVTTFSDTGLTPSTGYMYRVFAFNTVGDSANPTNVLDVTTTTGTAPAAPSNLLSSSTASSITLTWTDNSNGAADGFIVQIATDKNFTQSVQTFTVVPDVFQYQFFPLAPNTKYYMQVAAFNAAGSSWSAAVSDKTLK